MAVRIGNTRRLFADTHLNWRPSELAGVDIGGALVIAASPGARTRLPCSGENGLCDAVKLADAPEGELPQPRSDHRRRDRVVPEHPRRRPGMRQRDAVSAVASGDERVDQGQQQSRVGDRRASKVTSIGLEDRRRRCDPEGASVAAAGLTREPQFRCDGGTFSSTPTGHFGGSGLSRRGDRGSRRRAPPPGSGRAQ
jgi:hypothetical protein